MTDPSYIGQPAAPRQWPLNALSSLLQAVVRAPDAPNGTAEVLVDAAIQAAAAGEDEFVTLGLAPFAGPVASPLRWARTAVAHSALHGPHESSDRRSGGRCQYRRGQAGDDRNPRDPVKLIQEAVETFQAAFAAKQISLTAEVGSDDMLATFDHDRMLQVMANLVTNALKFTEPGGSIRVRCRKEEDHVHISVVDTGCGIPNNMLARIFERFWQVGKNDGRGVGLGLYISQCIVEAHSGNIWAESQVGVGSTLTFTLPTPGAGAPASIEGR